MSAHKFLCTVIVALVSLSCRAQNDTATLRFNTTARVDTFIVDSSKQRDVIDILYQILNKKASQNARLKAKKLIFSVVPAVGYSLSTGFGVDLTANCAFYTSSDHRENLSAIDAEVVYDTKNQKIFVSRSEIWSHDNRYKVTSEILLERYPVDTYGLGTETTIATQNPVVYSFLRLHGTLFRRLFPDYYIGLGYYYDYHYNISQEGNANHTIPDFDKYGFSPQSTSSGFVVNFLFDNRRNPINPLQGGYFSLLYRDNSTVLGSNNNWQELQFDFRRYIKVSRHSNNVFAIWAIMDFTKGNVPYLDLPATADDAYNNSGRGYPEQRFRGRNELYLEGEYRFGILHNGLIGGVVFANGQTFSGYPGNTFERVAPAAGTGIRIKINKHSNTNVCLDYAYGVASHGLFVNLGEMF